MRLKIYFLIENRDHRRFKVVSNFLKKELNNIVSSKKETQFFLFEFLNSYYFSSLKFINLNLVYLLLIYQNRKQNTYIIRAVGCETNLT
jgi:hypothetical protein